MTTKSKQRRSDCPHKHRLISPSGKDRIYTNLREAKMMLRDEKLMGFNARIETLT